MAPRRSSLTPCREGARVRGSRSRPRRQLTARGRRWSVAERQLDPAAAEVRDAATGDADDVVAARAAQEAGGEGGTDAGGAGDRGDPAGGRRRHGADIAQPVQGDVVGAVDVALGPFALLANVDELDGLLEQAEGEAVEVPGVGFGDREADAAPRRGDRLWRQPDMLQNRRPADGSRWPRSPRHRRRRSSTPDLDRAPSRPGCRSRPRRPGG